MRKTRGLVKSRNGSDVMSCHVIRHVRKAKDMEAETRQRVFFPPEEGGYWGSRGRDRLPWFSVSRRAVA